MAMSEQNATVDLFALGQNCFNAFIKEFALYGIQADPDIELCRGNGMLCYYSLDDRKIYLSVPDLNSPTGKLQALFFRSLLGCDSNEDLLHFFGLFIPHIIAHELAHHYRHRYGLFGDSLWEEEQIANKLAVAVSKHRLPPQEKAYARNFLQKAIESLSAKMEEKNIAVDSYYSALHALNVSGQIGVSDFENIELMETVMGVSADDMLIGSGQLSDEFVQRLEQKDDLIENIDEQYASDQLKYIYYHLGWLYLDLTSRETEYVDEFARNYLNLGADLLPLIHNGDTPTDEMVQACFKAYQDTQACSATISRYFYKRYRSLLLAKLQATDLQVAAHTEHLKRETTLILEKWSEKQQDMLNYLSQLAPPGLRALFPHLVAQSLNPQLDIVANLPTRTDRRLWQHIMYKTTDSAAANTLYRLQMLDQTDIYRPLPAELMLEFAHRLSLIKFAPGEPVIWEDEYNDDVYFLIKGKLEVSVTRNGKPAQIGLIEPGEMFGEVAFFTEDPRIATVKAVEPSECFVLTDADLQLLAYSHPTILMQMAGALAKRLTDMYETGTRETV